MTDEPPPEATARPRRTYRRPRPRPRAPLPFKSYCHVVFEPSLVARLKQITQRPTAREALEFALADFIMRHWDDPPSASPGTGADPSDADPAEHSSLPP